MNAPGSALHRWVAYGTSLALCLASVPACRDNASRATGASPQASAPPSGTGSEPPAPTFQVRRDTSDLAFVWFDEHGAPHGAARLDDIPEASRDSVRVDSPHAEDRPAGWVFLTDLRTPASDGTYPVHAVTTSTLARALAARSGVAAAQAQAPAPSAVPANVAPVLAPPPPRPESDRNARVVIYGASWCSACHQAAGWLRGQNIPYVEHDIEREPDAARRLSELARAQGVPLGSIPIIEINGRLMVGFDPAALQRALRGV